jgi:uncharacterized protein (TIGR00159 family)
VLSELIDYLRGQDLAELGRDLLDTLIVYYVFYRIFLVLRGTRALQIGVGLALVALLYVVAQLLHLATVLTLLNAVLSSAILIGVVVFQSDIRRGLIRMGARAQFGSGQNLEAEVIDSIVEAATQLARHRIGAIITFEQEANLDEFVGSHTGFVIDAAVSPDLLISLFIPEGMNKMHDGSVIIRDLRIAKAGVFFPMPEGRVMDLSFGSRHRAAMGITEETDAVVVVVSEERGTISFCFNGNIVSNLDGDRLRSALESVFAPKRRRKQRAQLSVWQRLLRRIQPALAELATGTEDRKSIALDKALSVDADNTNKEPATVDAALPLRKTLEGDEPPASVRSPAPTAPTHEEATAPLRQSVIDRVDPQTEEIPAPLRKLTKKQKKDNDPNGQPQPLRKRPAEDGHSEGTPLRHMTPKTKDPSPGERPSDRPTPAKAPSIPPPRPMPSSATEFGEVKAHSPDDDLHAARRLGTRAGPGAGGGGEQ